MINLVLELVIKLSSIKSSTFTEHLGTSGTSTREAVASH